MYESVVLAGLILQVFALLLAEKPNFSAAW